MPRVHNPNVGISFARGAATPDTRTAQAAPASPTPETARPAGATPVEPVAATLVVPGAVITLFGRVADRAAMAQSRSGRPDLECLALATLAELFDLKARR